MFIAKNISRSIATVAAAALLTAGAAPAFAADPDTTAKAPAKVQDAPEKKARQICVKSEITGSRMARTTCKTRDQWIKQDGVDPLNMQAR